MPPFRTLRGVGNLRPARGGAPGPRAGPQAHLEAAPRRAIRIDRPPRLRTAGPPEVIAMDGRLDLTRARREAKALLAAMRADDPAAKLSDAQLAVARDWGERSWPALVRRAEAEAAARP